MKNISKLLVIMSFGFLLQNCSTNNVDNDFSYESLTDTISGDPFRNRKYDYARVKVVEKPSLKIPTGLNGEKIKPKLKLPESEGSYAKSQVRLAKKEMLPPNYTVKFDMAKIVSDQLSKISISVVYDDSGDLKLVFREPIAITVNVLEEYFKEHSQQYKITSEKDEILSGHLIVVKDVKKDLIFAIKARKVDDLSSLVKVNAVFKNDGETQAPNHIQESVSLLSEIRKNLNDTQLKGAKNLELLKEVEAQESSNIATSIDKEASGLGGLLGSKKRSFGFGSYDRTIDKARQQEATQSDQLSQNYTEMTAPSDDKVYDSDAQAQVLNT